MTSPSFPRRPNQSPPPQRKTNRPPTHPSTCSALRLPGQGTPPKCHRCWPPHGPIFAHTHSAHPGGFAYLAAVPTRAGGLAGAGGLGCERARSLRSRGPREQRPLHCCPGSDRRPPAPGGAAASAARALGPASEPKGQI